MLLGATAMVGTTSNACPSPENIAAVNQIEDAAFNALKDANLAVAAAARNGSIGAAGDAEWSRYKALRGQAEEMRAKLDRGCYFQLKAASTNAAAPSQPSVIGGAATQPAVLATSAASTSGVPLTEPRFSVSVSGDYRGLDISSHPRLGIGQLPITVVQSYQDAALTQPLGTATYAPLGSGLGPLNDASAAHVSASGNGGSLSFGYAPNGQTRDGWRFNFSVGYQSTSLTSTASYTSQPIASTGPFAVSTSYEEFTCPGFAECAIPIYLRQTPSQIPEYSIGGNDVESIGLDQVRQVEQAYSFHASAGRRFSLSTFIGDINITPMAELGVRWWSAKETEVLSNIAFPTSTFYGSISNGLFYRRTADGPGFMSQISTVVDGPFPLNLPARWRLLGGVGESGVDLTAHSRSTLSSPVGGNDYLQLPLASPSGEQTFSSQTVGYIGAGVSFNLPWDTIFTFDYLRRRDTYLRSDISDPSGAAKASITFGDGTSIRIAPVEENEFQGQLTHLF
jgi:hypothetical protein